jgi:3-hydroxyisobutyrate dehydrogenase-like beta-hydroxyacid dehydrogenase
LDPKKLANILNTSTGRCWASDTNNPVPGALDNQAIPSNKNYNGGFGVALIAKDLSLAQKAAIATDSNTTFGSNAYNVYKHLTNENFGLKDFGYVYEYIRNKKTN